jgi:hypothetical protein
MHKIAACGRATADRYRTGTIAEQMLADFALVANRGVA